MTMNDNSVGLPLTKLKRLQLRLLTSFPPHVELFLCISEMSHFGIEYST